MYLTSPTYRTVQQGNAAHCRASVVTPELMGSCGHCPAQQERDAWTTDILEQDSNPNLEGQFLLNACCFHTTFLWSWKAVEPNPPKSGTVFTSPEGRGLTRGELGYWCAEHTSLLCRASWESQEKGRQPAKQVWMCGVRYTIPLLCLTITLEGSEKQELLDPFHG